MIRVKHNILNIKNPNTGEYESVPAVAGESAYDIAVRNGFVGSEKDWLSDFSGTGVYCDRAGTANYANHLKITKDIGSNIKPVYFTSEGIPVETDYELGRACMFDITDDPNSKTNNLVTVTALQTVINTFPNKTNYDDESISVGRQIGPDVGKYSSAVGLNVIASGECSHAEGYETSAKAPYTHAEGSRSTANDYCSHAEGEYTLANGTYSHAEGYRTTALLQQHAQGHFNNTTTATENNTQGTSSGTAFVIGNGTSRSKSNSFRVTGEGKIYASNASVNTGADYAEYFEWADGNSNNKDRVGYFVTFDTNNPEKIKIASEGDYVLGIVSGMPSVIGNGDECWKQRYVLDNFGRYIEETFEYEETGFNSETSNKSTVTKTGTKWKENPDYDPSKDYIPRDQRPEWDAIGMIGVLSVYDNGKCKVNEYCKCGNDGIAIPSERGYESYRVISRISKNIIKVVLK